MRAMQDSRILSSFQDLSGTASTLPLTQMPDHRREVELVFETCQLGVVLRVVLFVQSIAWVVALYGAPSVLGWLETLAVLTAASLPSALIWLLLTCATKKQLARLPMWGQWTAGIALGAAAAIYGCGLLSWTGLVSPAPWLASAASGALIAAVIVAGLVWRSRAKAPAGTTARLAELQARIRPHFLFNTLNSAIALVRAEPAKAEALLEDLSELFRAALADSKQAVPLQQELALAEHYLAIEQVRFGDRLKVEWNIDEKAAGARLPPLILQPLVENAVKHGVEPSPTGATVRITTKRRGSVVVIKVTNTVPSGTGAPGHGLALDNVRQRLALQHDVQGRFQSALVDGVFQARLEIPI